MDYSKLLQAILDIAEEMLVAGAEVNRVENSIERMCSAYGCDETRVNVFIITSNIQVALEDPNGEIITQIRRVIRSDSNYERLDRLNDLSRYICEHRPEGDELKRRYNEVMKKPKYSSVIRYLSAVLVAGGFAVFFEGMLLDGLSSAIVGLVIMFFLIHLGKYGKNQVALIFATSLVASAAAIFLSASGLGAVDKIAIGSIMLLIPGIALTNSVRDMLLGDVASGLLRLANSVLIALFIAFGFAIPLAFIRQLSNLMQIELFPNILTLSLKSGEMRYAVQILAAFVGCVGFSLFYNLKKNHIVYASIGGAATWAVYLFFSSLFRGDLFVPTLLASIFAGVFAEAMAKINKAPATVFLTSAAVPLVPGSALYSTMRYVIEEEEVYAAYYGRMALEVAIAISLGFMVVAIANRYYSEYIKKHLAGRGDKRGGELGDEVQAQSDR